MAELVLDGCFVSDEHDSAPDGAGVGGIFTSSMEWERSFIWPSMAKIRPMS